MWYLFINVTNSSGTSGWVKVNLPGMNKDKALNVAMVLKEIYKDTQRIGYGLENIGSVTEYAKYYPNG